METFWKHAISTRPDLVGATVYFCPSSIASLACVVREDGTISPKCASHLRYNRASKLVDAVKNGEIPVHSGFRISDTIRSSSYKFANDFFLGPGRRQRVSNLLGRPEVLNAESNEADNDNEPMDVTESSMINGSFGETDASSSTINPVVSSSTSELREPSNTTAGPSSSTNGPDDDDGPIVDLTAASSTPPTDIQVVNHSDPQNNQQCPNGAGKEASIAIKKRPVYVAASKPTIDKKDFKAREIERFGNQGNFWRIAIKVKPELIGKTVYFCPSTSHHVPCIVNGDGTVSPTTDLSKRYREAKHIASDMNKGLIAVFGSHGSVQYRRRPNWSSCRYTCSKDFFLAVNRNHRVDDTLGKFRFCRGIKFADFSDVVKERRWDSDRAEFSPVVVDDEQLRAKSCAVVFFHKMDGVKACEPCRSAKKTLRQIRARHQKNPTNDHKRIMFSGAALLTEDERKKKADMLRGEIKMTKATVRRLTRKIERLEAELKTFKPRHNVNYTAVRSVIAYLNQETAKCVSPQCCWLLDDGVNVCGFTADSLSAMCAHVRSEHHQTEIELNAALAEHHDDGDNGQNYHCRWKDCNHRPFSTYHQLHLHSFEHTGSRATVQRLSATRCHLQNLTRPATARRYNDALMERLQHEYAVGHTRASWQHTRMISAFPLPASTSNRNGAKNGHRIDEAVDSVLNNLRAERVSSSSNVEDFAEENN